MTPEEVKLKLEDGLEGAEVSVEGDGSHFQVKVISEQFEGLRAVPRQQKIYSILNDHITSGELHAIGINTYTPEEWEKAKNLQVG